MKNILIIASVIFMLVGCGSTGGSSDNNESNATVEVVPPTYIDFNNSVVIIPTVTIPFEGGDFDITFIPPKDKNLILEEEAIMITKSVNGNVVDSEWANIYKDIVHDIYKVEGTIKYDYNPLDKNISSRIDAIYYVDGKTILFQSVDVIQMGNLIEQPTVTANYEKFTVVTDDKGNITITENSPNDFLINNITEDDYINIAESLSIIPVSGISKVNATISFVINGNTYSTQANNEGIWSVDVSGNDLSLFDNFNVTAVGVDEFGETYTESSISRHLIKITTDALVIPNNITNDNNVTAEESNETIAVSGVVTGDLSENDNISINSNGIIYNTVVLKDGTWTVDINGTDLYDDIDNSIVVHASGEDIAGNPISVTVIHSYTIE